MRERPVRDFDQARSLGDEALRDLLQHGEAVERVWAIWILAQRAVDAGELAARVAGEPSAGVRRALAVVLAGHGHVDLLVAFARHDPDPEVRASAMRLVIRFAEAARVPWTIVTDALGRDAAPVRAAIASELRAAAPAEVRAHLLVLLDDEARGVRVEAFETLVRTRTTDPAIGAALLGWLDRCDPTELQLALRHWRAADGDAAFVAALAGATRAVRWHALQLIGPCHWAPIAPLLEGDLELFESVLWQLRREWSRIPLQHLIDCAGRPEGSWQILQEIEPRLAQLRDPDPALRASVARFADRCDALIARYRELATSDTPLPDGWDDEVEDCYEVGLLDPESERWIVALRDRARRLAAA